jgi:predicted HTH domain antitoxin
LSKFQIWTCGSVSLTSSAVRLELAVGLYTGKETTLGRAAKVAGIPYVAFLRELGRRGIAMNYSKDDALADIRVAEELSGSALK